jgi:hypothetical protein
MIAPKRRVWVRIGQILFDMTPTLCLRRSFSVTALRTIVLIFESHVDAYTRKSAITLFVVQFRHTFLELTQLEGNASV